MRFYGTLSLNGKVVGKGFGNSKKQVKFVAARLALQNIAPGLLQQW
jgi:dsRNA-specific ribonuclease